jgi:hypothetical protein
LESKGSADAYRREVRAALREETDEIVREIIERVKARDKEWLKANGGHSWGLKKTVRAILEHACCVIEGKEEQQLHPDVIAHSRALARAAFETHTLLERYTEGKTVFKEHLRNANAAVKVRSQDGYAEAEKSLESAFEDLLREVGREHRAECLRLKRSSAARLLESVKQLLSGELMHPPADLSYDFSATHIGVVGSGVGVENEIKRLAQVLGGQTLLVPASPNQVWAWIGLKLGSSADRLDDALKAEWDDTVHMGIGKPAAGIPGWRRTHRQAEVVLPIGIRGDTPVVRYANVALLATTASDELLQDFLWEDYLVPLASTRDEGETLKATLRAYFSKDRQISSAAKALGIKRHTVRKRLDDVEEMLGRTLDSCAAELELALRCEELLPSPSSPIRGREQLYFRSSC